VGCYFTDLGYRVVIGEAIPVPATGSRTEQVASMTQRLAIELESIVSEAPSQWHLVQPNWPSDREEG
jgi:KDO2-lipid IV(A) lauroyltransferase